MKVQISFIGNRRFSEVNAVRGVAVSELNNIRHFSNLCFFRYCFNQLSES